MEAKAVGPEVAVGIDVSKYQGGINWQQVKKAVENLEKAVQDYNEKKGE